MAAEKNHPSLIQLLTNKDADVNSQNSKNGKTALHIASELGHVDASQMLLDCGVNVSIADDEGNAGEVKNTAATIFKIWVCQNKNKYNLLQHFTWQLKRTNHHYLRRLSKTRWPMSMQRMHWVKPLLR